METLRTYRKARGLTLSDLAMKIGVTEGQLSRIERMGGASLATAVKLEEVTGLPAATFARREQTGGSDRPQGHAA